MVSRLAALALYVSTIVVANWAVRRFGLVPVGFGLTAPAGVYAAGAAFTMRDVLHELAGRRWVVGAIVLGAGLSYWIGSGRLALASGVAFLTSELLDLAVYVPVRRRGWLTAVVASNVAGLVVDSILFLLIAFGSLAHLAGQVIGKLWVTVGTVAVVGCVRLGVARA